MEIKNLFTPEAQQFGSQLAWVARKVAKPLQQPIQELWQQFTAKVQPAIQWIQDTVNTGFVEPIVKPIKEWVQRVKAVQDINTAFSDAWINLDDIKMLAEDEGIDFNQVLTKFQNNWIKVQWMEEMQAQQEAKAQEIPQWEDLWVMGNIKEGAIGAFRAGEQIPRIIGSWLWYVGEKIGEWLDVITPWLGTGSKELGQKFQQLGSDVTMAGMTDGGTNPLTQKQINARQTGGELALTAPIGGWYVAWATWVWWLALRSGVVGAGFGAAQPIIDKGWQATMWDIATGWALGGVTGAVAWPLISKVIAPAIGGIASKTGKYWQALVKWGAEWLKKSVARDIASIKTPWVETVTRNIPKAVVRRDLWFTPTERAKIEKITWLDEGTYILNKGLAWKWKEELAEVFMKQSDDMYNGITKELSKVKTPVKSEVAKEALQDIMEQLESSPKIARAYAKDIAWVKSMLARDEFTLSELNNIRRAYDKVNTGMFTVQGKARSGLENAVDVKVRWDLSNQLQKEAKKVWVDVKAMNTELRAWLEMKDALLRRLSQEERNNFIWLQDLWVSAILSGWNPVSAVATIAAKKYAEKVAPGLAQKAYNLNKAPNVTRTVSRGNTIVNRNKSSGLGLGNSTDNTVVSNPVNKVTPKWVQKKTVKKDPLQEKYDAEQKNAKPIVIEKKPIVTPTVPKNTVNTPIVEKTATEVIKPKNSIYTSQEKAESYVKWYEKELSTPGISNKSITYLKKWLEDAKQEVELWKSLNKPNAKQQGIKQKNQDTINDELINDYQTNLTSEIKKWTQLNRIPTSQEFIKSKEVVNPIKSKDNITRNEAIQKWFSDSAKTRWDKWDFTRKEIWEAKSYLKSNYKGKQYNIDWKNYKVDAIDNRNEQVRLIDSNGDIIRVKVNNLPETKLTDKDVFDYYNSRVQKWYKTEWIPKKK